MYWILFESNPSYSELLDTSKINDQFIEMISWYTWCLAILIKCEMCSFF
jgi:hypothetical protein